jgi:hypothetical protein
MLADLRSIRKARQQRCDRDLALRASATRSWVQRAQVGDGSVAAAPSGAIPKSRKNPSCSARSTTTPRAAREGSSASASGARAAVTASRANWVEYGASCSI